MRSCTEPSADIIASALAFLRAAADDGFQESYHLMPFPRSQGFTGHADMQVGDVFAPALAADALLDANDARDGTTIAAVIRHLLARRRTAAPGGWSYFPDLPELPADADDLAQVISLFVRAGRRDLVARYCEAPLLALLASAPAHGPFSTWILLAAPATPTQALQAEWTRLAWGDTCDVEVVANLAYALILYDAQRFGPVIVRAANWVAEQQQADGSWRSTWYHGPYYGTWQALRLIAGMAPHHPAIPRARQFLLDHYRADSGWDAGAAPDPLSSALALLALAATRLPLPWNHVRDSLAAMASIAPWPTIPFIRMELGRAGGGPITVLSHGSRTVTALFALKAALAIRRLD